MAYIYNNNRLDPCILFCKTKKVPHAETLNLLTDADSITIAKKRREKNIMGWSFSFIDFFCLKFYYWKGSNTFFLWECPIYQFKNLFFGGGQHNFFCFGGGELFIFGTIFFVIFYFYFRGPKFSFLFGFFGGGPIFFFFSEDVHLIDGVTPMEMNHLVFGRKLPITIQTLVWLLGAKNSPKIAIWPGPWSCLNCTRQLRRSALTTVLGVL